MKIDYENLLPKDWHPILKEEFRKEIEDYVFLMIRTNFNYLEADKFKISSVIDREETFEDIVYTLALDKMINIVRKEPPYILIENVSCYDDSMYIFPGQLLYNEAKYFFYLFPEKPIVLKNAYPYKGKIKIYYTSDKIGEKYLDVAPTRDIQITKVYISSAIAFYIVQEIDGNVTETFVAHTTDVLDFYDTFKNSNAKDILVLSSYKDSIKVFMSSRFVEKFQGKKVKMMFINYPDFMLRDLVDSNYVVDLIYTKSTLKIIGTPVEKTINGYRTGVYLYPPKTIPALHSYLKRMPYLSRFNGIIRSIDDFVAVFLKRFEHMHDAEIYPYKYIKRGDNGNILLKKIIYFLVLANDSYDNTEIQNFIENELYRYYDPSFRKMRCMFLSNEHTFDENLVNIFSGNNSYYQYVRKKNIKITKQMPKAQKLQIAFEHADLFVINAKSISFKINLESESDLENIIDYIVFTRMKHYTKVIRSHINFEEIVSLISQSMKGGKINKLVIQEATPTIVFDINNFGDNTNDVLYEYPNTLEGTNVYKLIDVKKFVENDQTVSGRVTGFMCFKYLNSFVKGFLDRL